MIDILLLLWRFLLAQPWERYLQLMPWHLLALLCVLGILSALGLHFLAGYVFRFYRRKEHHSVWVAAPTLVVLLVSVQLLLGAYVLGVRTDVLVEANLAAPKPGEATARLGRLLLAPAFATPALASQDEKAIPGSALVAALNSIMGFDYREALLARLHALEGVAPAGAPPAGTSPPAGSEPTPAVPATPGQPAPGGTAPAPAPQGTPGSATGPQGPAIAQGDATGGARPMDAGDLLMALALTWVTNPDAVPPQPAGTGAAATEPPQPSTTDSDGTFFLPEFIRQLVDEVQPQISLSRAEWEHVAGTNFADRVLRPVLVEYISYVALALAVLVLLVDGLYFYLMHRLKRIGTRPPAKAKPARKVEPLPKPTPAAPPTEVAPPPAPTEGASGEKPASTERASGEPAAAAETPASPAKEGKP